MKNMLEMRNITKAFFGVKALSEVNLTVREGEILAIVGENGAGKSTLMNILSGTYPYGSYTGEILLDGEACRFGRIRDSEKQGIVIIHQELALNPYMSIAENIFLGNECARFGILDWMRTSREAETYMDMVALHENPLTLVKDIGVGKQQLVEIAKALAKNVRLLILDVIWSKVLRVYCVHSVQKKRKKGTLCTNRAEYVYSVIRIKGHRNRWKG